MLSRHNVIAVRDPKLTWEHLVYHLSGQLVATRTRRLDVDQGSSGSSTTNSSRSGKPLFRPTMEAPRVKATTAPAAAQALSVVRPNKQQPADENDSKAVIDINDKLAEYSSFMKYDP